MMHDEIEPAGTYRPQYHLRWRGMVRMFDRFPRFKEYLAGTADIFCERFSSREW